MSSTSVVIDDVKYNLDVIRFPNNATDYIVSTPDSVIGILSLQLMPGVDNACVIIGQAVPDGAPASLYEGITTRIIDGKTYMVNCVYQLNLCERDDPAIVDNATVGLWTKQAIADLSGYKGTIDSLAVMVVGSLTYNVVGDEIHYMVGDIVFSKGKVQQ